ncbi:hypothetical protein PMAG_a4016 [Pseudoalteromonas mariniglutinosa NCIMB 1770]|nr:hypothetical protein [Pseudoalteromonas mariniglutinosa NCIMB 1770]
MVLGHVNQSLKLQLINYQKLAFLSIKKATQNLTILNLRSFITSINELGYFI